jgi:hypothetical protein
MQAAVPGRWGWSKLVRVGEFAPSSEAFTHGGEIPRGPTCEGDDVPPALSRTDAFNAVLMGTSER